MRFCERYLMALSWLEPGTSWRTARGAARHSLEHGLLFLLATAWATASPLMALYGAFRPTQLFKFVQWIKTRN